VFRGCPLATTNLFEYSIAGATLMLVVKFARLQAPARVLTVALLMISWLLATNHCGLAMMMQTKSTTEHLHCCSKNEAPTKSLPRGAMLQCCKAIHGTPAPEKAGAKFDRSNFELQLYALLLALAPVSWEKESSAFLYDLGPPRAVSFAELVLQRSVLAHAPPFVA
jgi:hypothetical protein